MEVSLKDYGKIDAMERENNNQREEIERLRAILRECMPGTRFVDLGDGETLFLYQQDCS